MVHQVLEEREWSLNEEEEFAYRFEHWIDNEMRIHVIQDCENYWLISDWLFHENDRVLNECNQHVVRVEVELHFDPKRYSITNR